MNDPNLAKNEYIASPGETLTVGIDYGGQLATGEVINSPGTWSYPTGVSEVAKSNTDSSVTVAVLIADNVNDSGPMTLEIKNETTTDGGNTPEDCLLLRIEDCA